VLKVLTCVSMQHDIRLVLLAVGVCAAACFLAFRLYTEALRRDSRFRSLWLASTGLVTGSGIWATHFIAMMAYEPNLQSRYQPFLTVLSWLIACIGTGVAFAFAVRFRSLVGRLLCGAGLGLVISAMHYVGMAAFHTQGVLLWNPTYVAASIILGAALAAASLVAAGDAASFRRRTVGALILAGGIASMHFTAMAAASILPDPSVRLEPPVLSSVVIAALTATVAVLGIFAALAATAIAKQSQIHALADLREAIEALPAGLGFYDADDRLVIWNGEYAEHGGDVSRLLKPGVPFADLIRGQLAHGAHADGVGREEAWLADRLSRRRNPAGPEEQLQGDRWLRVEDRRTARGGTISVSIDITDLKRDAEALAQARDAAEAANRAKSEFLANMSHELRTPLNGVIGVAHAMGRTGLSAEQRDMLTLIESSAHALESVLSDLLDLARIDSGRMELQHARFDLGEVMREAAALWRLEAEKKGLRLDLDISPSAEAAVEGDPVRLRQIVVNLLSNAVKFTETGGVRIAVSRLAHAPARLLIEVTDTGVGFEPELAERLFERFEQADGSYTRTFGGAGLGLALCRDLAERMGGTITAEGQPGVGATFRVELALPALAATPASAAPSAEPAEGDRPMRVLSAEDHPINRKVVESILQCAGAELLCVENGQLALESFKAHDFDAVLMDMQMPVMDGLTATRAIRDYETSTGRGRTPVIMLTAHAMPEHVAASHAAGADRHLAKPIAAADLLSALSEVVSQSEALRAA